MKNILIIAKLRRLRLRRIGIVIHAIFQQIEGDVIFQRLINQIGEAMHGQPFILCFGEKLIDRNIPRMGCWSNVSKDCQTILLAIINRNIGRRGPPSFMKMKTCGT